MRTAPEGAALWTPAPRRGGDLCGRHQRALPSGLPLGLCPRPRDAAHLLPRLRAGRGIGCVRNCIYSADRPAKRQGSPVGKAAFFMDGLRYEITRFHSQSYAFEICYSANLP